MARVYFALSIWFGLVLVSCELEPVTGLQPGDIPYRIESEQVALFYSGELRPPAALTKKVSRELFLIRETWYDSIPAVDTKFLLPWSPSHLTFGFDDTAYANIIDSQNQAWNDLCHQLNVEYYQFSFPGNYIGIKSGDLLNPLLLGEYFIDFPGINYIQSAEVPHPYPHHFVRFEDYGESKYFFQTWCAPVVLSTFYYFKVDNDSAYFMGRHAECYEAYDSLISEWPYGIDSLYWYMTAYEDSVEQARPRWVDTARYHISRLEYGNQFWWTRP